MTSRNHIRAQPRPRVFRSLAWLLLTVLASCETAHLPTEAVSGPHPTIETPRRTLIPTVKIAPARGWPEGATPSAARGLKVSAYASGLDHPRWLYVLPNGDVLVAESNGPARPQDNRGIKGWFMKMFMKRAGAGVQSADRITLLRDVDGDGQAETRTVFLEHLHSPFGMALIDRDLYVADTDALLRVRYESGAQRVVGAATKVLDLPAGPINHHWTKNVIASNDGQRLYVTIGSNSNAAENGLNQEVDRARILEIDRSTGRSRVFASGLRNPVGLAWEPQTGALWTAVNERDELGSDLVPDFMTAVHDGAFYGWPFSYYGQHIDRRVEQTRPDLVATARVPDYALGAHTASLGLAFAARMPLTPHYASGAFVGQHGSWNRRPPSGYKVVFVPFSEGSPSGPLEDVLTGFLDGEGRAMGRPVGVAFDRSGALLVADDVGNKIWRVTSSVDASR